LADARRRWTRQTLLPICFALIGLGLAARLIHIQWICRDQFTSKAHRQQISDEAILARPGNILDRHGRLLATSITVPSLYLNPSRVKNPQQLAGQLAIALRLNPVELKERLIQNADRKFLWIKRHLTDEEASEVRQLKLPEDLAGFRSELERRYPQGTLAAHVIGLRNIDGVGQGGIEEAFDSLLQGHDGIRRFVRDARGFVLSVLEEVTEPPRDGTNIVLTIDTLLQFYAERELDALMQKHRARGACAIVLDPRSVEILALASRPTFDPNHPEGTPPEAWKNLATSAVYEPGSTFKPLVVAWGLDSGLIERDEIFDCEHGVYRMGPRTLHDDHHYGLLSLNDVLVKSSNIGMAKIGQRLGNEQLFQLAIAFGFGQKTGIELPGELPGILHPLPDWTSYSTGSIPMGQELAATPLQVLAAHAVLANHGRRITPHLLLTTTPGTAPGRKVVVSQVVSPESADWLVQGPLLDVVQKGTGNKARLPGIEVFGKTGTAQKANVDDEGYSSGRHFSSFVCGAPADDPRLLVLVSVDEPEGDDQFGGIVAAPFAAAILEQALATVWCEESM
jgi:cell division protein FtsI/penicillin-binding protein 2